MIGNDIVDIEEARQKSNWQRPRFLEKLFTLKEQQLIYNSDNSFLMVWRLWSMKEAAYKLYTQLQPSRFYNPKKFECEINYSDGKVRYRDFLCYVKTKITSQYILSESHLVATKLHSECIKIWHSSPKTQSENIRAILLSKVSEKCNILQQDMRIVKSEFGVPSVYNKSKKLNIGVSISHHGNYGAYAIST